MTYKSKQYIRLVSKFRNGRLIGEKARGIKYLIENGFRVPLTYVCSSKAYDEYLKVPQLIMNVLEEELESKVNVDEHYSVRSSATIEDDPIRSFAGQFKTFLNVKGTAKLLASIKKVWESTKSNRVSRYSEKTAISLDNLKMAIIIQQMVKADFSGVVFTKNPLNGRDEIILEAVEGLGDSMQQDGVNPCRGVYKWGEWVEKPDTHIMSLSILENVAKRAKVLEKKRRKPLNLEWAYDGQALYWLQVREITALSGLNFYSNKLAKEFLPGIIKPLVWSINIPVVCGAWVKLLSELNRNINFSPEDLAKAFFYRAYFNMGVIGDVFDTFGMPREGLEILMGYGSNAPEKPSLKPGFKLLKNLPNLLLFTLDKAFFGRKMRKFINKNDEVLEKICSRHLKEMSEIETIEKIDKLLKYNVKAAYFVVVSQLLNSFYNKIFTDQLERKGGKIEDVNLGYANFKDVDPNWGIWKLHQTYFDLPNEAKQKLDYSLKNGEEWGQREPLKSFKLNFEDFIRRFGHLSDQGNDFSRVHWREHPSNVLKMVIHYSGNSTVPKFRKGQDESRKISGILLRWLYKKARESLEYKERISFNYTRSYGLFRQCFLHLAKLLRNVEYIDDLEDIFYFTFKEVKEIVEEERVTHELKKTLDVRKREIAQYENVELPEVIYGDEAPVPIRKDVKLKILRGIPASGGYYTGNTCIVKGIRDFSKVIQKAVIVVPYSDISWTPIFTKAGAIVSESGGILSHSAIIAREYRIPSVVGVKGACSLGDGKKVIVDGFSGRITVC